MVVLVLDPLCFSVRVTLSVFLFDEVTMNAFCYPFGNHLAVQTTPQFHTTLWRQGFFGASKVGITKRRKRRTCSVVTNKGGRNEVKSQRKKKSKQAKT